MKKCNADGCNFGAYSHGYCWNHQYMRDDEKFKKQMEKHRKTFSQGSPIAPRSKKQGEGFSRSKTISFGFESQIEMFRYIWDHREQRSFLSDKPLDIYREDVWINLFAHVLDKKNYPLFKLNPDNIVLLTPYEHTLFDQGTEELRERYTKDNDYNPDWEKLYNYRDRLLEEYDEIVKL